MKNINVVNKHRHTVKEGECDVYCGRGSVLGNPFAHRAGTKAKFIVASREIAVERYKEYFKEQMLYNNDFLLEMRRIYALAKNNDVNLVCYCSPQKCHCEVLRDFLKSF